MGRALEIDGGDGCTTIWMHLLPLNCTHEMVKIVNFILCAFYHNKKRYQSCKISHENESI